MHLKHAKENNKLEHFIAEHEKTHPKASHRHFHGVVKSMVSQNLKPTRKTSKRASSGR
jgi:hypothetical protein